jgi:hypothetical protein
MQKVRIPYFSIVEIKANVAAQPTVASRFKTPNQFIYLQGLIKAIIINVTKIK